MGAVATVTSLGTNVSATLVDVNGQVWANARVIVTLQLPVGFSGSILFNGDPFRLQYRFNADDDGYFQLLALPDNYSIIPPDTTWHFSIAPNMDNTVSIQFNVSISGVGMDLSPTFLYQTSLQIPRLVQSFPIPRAADASEVALVPNDGQIYYNTTDQIIYTWVEDGWRVWSSQGPQGPEGPKGDKGDPGTGVTILGSYPDYASLVAAHPTGELGEAYLVDGDLYVWDGTQWMNVGTIQGPQGPPGPTIYPGAGVAVSAGTSWATSIDPTTIVRTTGSTMVGTARLNFNDPYNFIINQGGSILSVAMNNGFNIVPWTNLNTPMFTIPFSYSDPLNPGGYTAKFNCPLRLQADPIEPLQAATKQYVDNSIGSAVGNYLPLTGGTLTGPLTVTGAGGVGVVNATTFNATNVMFSPYDALQLYYGNMYLAAGSALNLNAGTQINANKPIYLPADPTAALQAATKQYVDAVGANAGVGKFLPLTGGTLTGSLTATSMSSVAGITASTFYPTPFPNTAYFDFLSPGNAGARIYATGPNTSTAGSVLLQGYSSDFQNTTYYLTCNPGRITVGQPTNVNGVLIGTNVNITDPGMAYISASPGGDLVLDSHFPNSIFIMTQFGNGQTYIQRGVYNVSGGEPNIVWFKGDTQESVFYGPIRGILNAYASDTGTTTNPYGYALNVRVGQGGGFATVNAPTQSLYLNWDSGVGGVIFGNGASGQVGLIDNVGNFSVNGQISAGGNINCNMTVNTSALSVSSSSWFGGYSHTQATLTVGDWQYGLSADGSYLYGWGPAGFIVPQGTLICNALTVAGNPVMPVIYHGDVPDMNSAAMQVNAMHIIPYSVVNGPGIDTAIALCITMNNADYSFTQVIFNQWNQIAIRTGISGQGWRGWGVHNPDA